MVIAGRASQEHLAPGGEYAEQKAETGCECESHVRVFLAYLMRFPIGISRHVSDAGKFFLGRAGHVIRKFANAFAHSLSGVGCIACS